MEARAVSLSLSMISRSSAFQLSSRGPYLDSHGTESMDPCYVDTYSLRGLKEETNQPSYIVLNSEKSRVVEK